MTRWFTLMQFLGFSWRDLLAGTLDLAFPSKAGCPLCGSRAVDGRRSPFCGACDEGLASALFHDTGNAPNQRYSEQEYLDIEKRPTLPQEDGPLKGIISAGRYEGTLSQALHLFKYASRRDLAQPLGALLAGAVERAGLHRLPSLLVPVPLHPTRLAWRGYNQAALLAEAVAATLPGLTVNECLERRINTRTQIGLGGPERRANVREAFRMRGGGQARGRPVILVDDIWTTGSTMEECARVLKRWGSGPVWGAAVAAGHDRMSAPGAISG